MSTRFATPLLVAGTVAGLLSLAACSSSSTAATTTAAASSETSTTAATASTTGAGTGSSTGGSTASSAGASTVPDSAATVDVKGVEGVAWDKKAYTATAKDGKVTINVVNSSSIAHNLYVEDGSGKTIGDFVNLPQKGSKGTIVVSLAPGTYRVVCKVPGHQNMNSTLTVN